MARCKNAPKTSSHTTPTVQIRQTLAEKGFVFKGTSNKGFPPSVMATIAMHKWENLSHILAQSTPTRIPSMSLWSRSFMHILQAQLSPPCANWDSANTSVDRDRLKPEGKLWMHFIKQRGARKVVAAKLAALITMAENMRDQLEGLKTDLRTYFNYVQERDQVIKANFNEMLPQSSLNFPAFPQDLLKPAETKMPDQQPAHPTAEHGTAQPQEKPHGSDSTSSSPTPPDATPQHHSPPTQRRKGKEPTNAPATPAVEIDSEETAAFEEEEEPQRTPTPPVATTPVRRRSKRTAQRVLVEDSEEEVQSGAGEEDQPMIIPPTHLTSIKRKATKRARRATTK
ncbi:hypothetical protein GQ457_08G027550 [Hibiscus cannabinus]